MFFGWARNTGHDYRGKLYPTNSSAISCAPSYPKPRAHPTSSACAVAVTASLPTPKSISCTESRALPCAIARSGPQPRSYSQPITPAQAVALTVAGAAAIAHSSAGADHILLLLFLRIHQLIWLRFLRPERNRLWPMHPISR